MSNRIAPLCAATLLACGGGGHSSDRPAPATAASTTAELALTETGVGPVGEKSTATVDALRPVLPGYELKAVYPPGLEPSGNAAFDLPADVLVSAGGKPVMLVLAGARGLVREIRIVSPDLAAPAGWRAGTTLDDVAAIGECGCLADGLACSAKGSQVGIILDEDCNSKLMKGDDAVRAAYRKLEAGDPAALAALRGRKIVALRWHSTANEALDPPPPPED